MFGIYYAPQIGTGTEEDPFRSLLNDFIDVQVGEWFDEIDNPARRFSICVVSASQTTHNSIGADIRCTLLIPTLAGNQEDLRTLLNTSFSSFSVGWRNAAQAKLEELGVSTTWITGTNTLRDVIRYILRTHFFAQIADGKGNNQVKSFLTRNLDSTIGSLSTQERNAAKDWMQERGLATGWITNGSTVRQVIHFVLENLGFGNIKLTNEVF